MKRLTFSFRIAVIFTVFIFFTVLLFSIINILLVTDVLMKQRTDSLANAYLRIRSVILSGDVPLQNTADEKTSEELSKLIIRESSIPYFFLFTLYTGGVGSTADENSEKNSYTVLASNDPFLPVLPLSVRNKKQYAKRYFEKDFFTDGDLNILYTAAPVFPGEQSAASTLHSKNSGNSVYLQVAVNMEGDNTDGILRRIVIIMSVISIPLIAVSFFIALYLSSRFLKPVKMITTTAQRISSTNLDQRIALSPSSDELTELAKTFNDLFERLESDFSRERRFTSDVSHELKTPLAVIVGHTELLKRWGKNDPAILESSLDAVHSEALSIRQLIDNLLFLSHTEIKGKASAQVRMETIQLLPILEKIKADTQLIAHDAVFDIICPQDLQLCADVSILIQVIRIIIQNSLKYSTAPAYIKITASDTMIQIEDRGIGISQKDLPFIFDRFYRTDESRSRKTGGSGLGLAIAKNLLALIDASITAESEKGKGTIMIIRTSKI